MSTAKPKAWGSVPAVSDAHWVPDLAHMDAARRQKPWRTDINYFTSVSVSLAATVKMFLHGTRGCPDVSQGRFNWFEVMGLLIGHFKERELVLTDSFSLPVAASEVECSMTEGSQIYMANYLEYHRRLGKAEPGCVGWYHTHPGYSCFLSGIDVTTQQGSQRMQDPWVALVIDPVETLRTGEFSMKAFRTYPEGQVPEAQAEGAAEPSATGSSAGDGDARGSASMTTATARTNAKGTPDDGYGQAPANRLKDFGMHAHRYYELPVRVVQSTRDAPLWALLQQHFWPLSLSLSFPFAPATRTCHGCSAALTAAVAQLASLSYDPQAAYRDERQRQTEADAVPLLYRADRRVKTAVPVGNADGNASADAAAEVEQRILEMAEGVLRARVEAFSLIRAANPAHGEVLTAMRAVGAAAAAVKIENERRSNRR